MLKIEGLLGIVVLALWIYCLVEVIGTPESRVRNLPKIVWIIIVLLFPLVGSIAWLVAGRPAVAPTSAPRTGPAAAFPEYDRPGRMRAGSPDDDEAFLREVRERAEEQRRRYRASRDGSAGDSAEPPPEEAPDDGSPDDGSLGESSP